MKKCLLCVVALCLFATLVFASSAPVPLLQEDERVDWWFVFKFNGNSHPGCDGVSTCLFGGKRQNNTPSGQRFVYASSKDPSLQYRSTCVGATLEDPLGATFDQIYRGNYFYVIWNDQFYGDPLPSRTGSWGHSKGILAWNEDGEGLVIQVSTPSWPGSGSSSRKRKTGNTLGCVSTNNNIQYSQHFFALRLNKPDVLKVLSALRNASVVTDPRKRQIVKNGGPPEIQAIVNRLGTKTKSTTRTMVMLSSGVRLISKPSYLAVPPWQMVSAAVSGVRLKTATWWASPRIESTTKTDIGCWGKNLGKPGAVEIATSGRWEGITFGLQSGNNHAKIGVSLDHEKTYAIFGDLNQQGTLSGTAKECAKSQNGRGGTFFVLDNKVFVESMAELMAEDQK